MSRLTELISPIVMMICVLVLVLICVQASAAKIIIEENEPTGELCEFPCWNGIVPGKTTLDEVRFILEGVDSYNTSDEKFEETSTSHKENHQFETVIRWRQPDDTQHYQIIFDDNIVYNITIPPRSGLTLGDVLGQYGEPQGIKILYYLGAEEPFVRVILATYYPQYGLVAVFLLFSLEGEVRVDKVEITPSAPVLRFVLYQSEKDLKDFAKTAIHPSGPFFILKGWPGLGSIIKSPNDKYYPMGLPVLLTPTPTVLVTPES